MGVRWGDEANNMVPELSSKTDYLVTTLSFLVFIPIPLRVYLEMTFNRSISLSDCDIATYFACTVRVNVLAELVVLNSNGFTCGGQVG